MFRRLEESIRELGAHTRSLAASVAALRQAVGRKHEHEHEHHHHNARPGEPAVWLRVRDRSGTEGHMGQLAIAMNDRQFYEFALTPSVVDADGKPLKNADGTPVTADQVAFGGWLLVGADADNNAVIGGEFAGDNKSGKITSGFPGSATATTVLTYPDGQTQSFTFNVAVGNSAAGDPSVVGEVKDEV